MKKIFSFLFLLLPMVMSCQPNPNVGKVTITKYATNCSFAIKDPETVPSGEQYSISVTPDDGYILNEFCFTVEIGNYKFYKDANAQYSTNVFNFENNKITIDKIFVTRDINITATARLIGNEGYKVETTGDEHTHFNPVMGVANSSQDYTLTISCDDDYSLDKENMTVSIGNVTYGPNDGAFSVDSDGKVTIFKEYINGNINVTCHTKEYNEMFHITTDGYNCTFNPSKDSVNGKNDYSITITKGKYSTIDINPSNHIFLKKSGGIYLYNAEFVPSSFEYVGDGKGGTFTIKKDFIDDDITVYCVLSDSFDPSLIKLFDLDLEDLELKGIEATPSSEDASNFSDLTVNLKPTEETQMIDTNSIKVTIGGITYDGEKLKEAGITIKEKEDGSVDVTIPHEIINGDVKVDASTTERNDIIKVYFEPTGCKFGDDAKEDYTFWGNNYETSVSSNENYEPIKKSNFTIYLDDSEIPLSDDKYNFESDKIIVFKDVLVEPVKKLTIYCKADETPKVYNVTYNPSTSNEYIDYIKQPTTITQNNGDLEIEIENKKSSDHGLIITVTLNGKEIESSLDSLDNENKKYKITIKNSAIDWKNQTGTINVKIESKSNIIQLSETYPESKPLKLLSYDNSNSISYTNNFGDLTITDNTEGKISFEDDKANKTLTIYSNSNDETSGADSYLTLSNGQYSTKVYVEIKHPTNVEEALDSTTLALIRGNEDFNLTFNYQNNEELDTYLSHLEIAENMKYYENQGLYSDNYKTGNNITNTFSLNGVSAHGREYAIDSEETAKKVYPNIPTVNYLNRKDVSGETSTLRIDNVKKPLLVNNSEELFWAVEHGYKPIFNDISSNAYLIYQKARQIVLQNTYDDMPTNIELRQLYEYLTSNTSYNYYLYNNAPSYPESLNYKSYFLEGVFLNNGIGVSDGFAKAYSLLCNIDGLEVIRSFGYGQDSTNKKLTHSYNYAKLDDSWYLVDVTYGKNLEDNNFSTKTAEKFEITNYDSFLVSSSIFFITNKCDFKDNTFPLHSRSTTNKYSNSLEIDGYYYGGKPRYYIIKSVSQLTALFNYLKENYDGTYNVCVSFLDQDDKTITVEEMKNWIKTAGDPNNSGFNSKYDVAVYSTTNCTYANIVYKKY